MRIAIDARGYNWYAGTGIGTYIQNIIKYISILDNENEYILYWHGKNYDEVVKGNIRAVITSRRGHRFFEEYFIPQNLVKNKIDVYHLPQNGIGFPEEKKTKIITTIHDLIPYIMPETVGKGYLKKFLTEMPKIIQKSDLIITVSNCSKKDIIRFFNVYESKVKVTYLAAEKYFKPLDKELCRNYLKSKYNINFDFLLYLGGFSKRKNVKSIILAYSKLLKNLSKDIRLVILGQAKDEKDELEKMCFDLNLEEKVIFTGYVPYEDLPYFYNASTIFLYPSLYEGFGLPPLEAMSCKTPVITSNVTSIPEIVGDGALLIDPKDIDALQKAIEELLSNDKLREDIANKGYERSKLFTWEKTVKETLNIYGACHLTF
ncbi:glycosyltransferase family 1 protein [Caloramator sp. CAR-1]|uniref:glycosyltransferase family 4 protein n=1 Tax=Caloramator sp. CAR-1 TaxID=3062777 RepID=UPI0026E22310|nr:glycosyltransferase family 1 protein [Caloramator sp. CAR-1]MDO6355768.1 glycosyltransferase family 1 protein [Caloramator sp. CAR-1]